MQRHIIPLLTGICLLAVVSLGYNNLTQQDCAGMPETKFKADFEFMTSRSEWCYTANECGLNVPHWAEDLSIQFLWMPDKDSWKARILTAIEEVRPMLQKATGVHIDANSERDPNTTVVILDDYLYAAIENGKIDGFDPTFFTDGAKWAYKNKACSATVLSSVESQTNRDIISSSIIYVNGNLDVGRIDKCFKEELYNALGMLSDPIGQASLFDNGNYKMIDGKISYSDASVLMLEALYGIARNEYRDIDAFIRQRCTR